MIQYGISPCPRASGIKRRINQDSQYGNLTRPVLLCPASQPAARCKRRSQNDLPEKYPYPAWRLG